MEFKERLRLLRKSQKMTQGDLAKVLNYGYTAISNYESGRNEPSITDLKKIAEYFNVSMDYLLCVNDCKNPYTEKSNLEPDEDFLEKYSNLKDTDREQLKSMLDWLTDRSMSLSAGGKSSSYKAAQKRAKYNTSSND